MTARMNEAERLRAVYNRGHEIGAEHGAGELASAARKGRVACSTPLSLMTLRCCSTRSQPGRGRLRKRNERIPAFRQLVDVPGGESPRDRLNAPRHAPYAAALPRPS